MATLTLQNWHANDDGTPRAGATVTYKAASASEPNANPVLGTTTTNASGRWQFTGVADGDYDVYLTDGVTVRFWKGLAALPLTFAKAPVGPVANALTNGDFSVWQRGTSFAAIVDAAYSADRWKFSTVAGATLTAARDTSVPTVGANAINTPYSWKLTVTAADASIAAADLYGVYQPIEGFDYRPLTNGMALSFWVRAHRSGTYCVAFTNLVDRSYVAEYTVSAADTWEYKTVVVPTPPTAGTWNYTTGKSLHVFFTFAVGSTYQTTANAWQTGAFFATSNQVNGVGATTDTVSLALVNLIPGSTAAPLVPLPYQQQLARCQRYCQVFADTGTEYVASGHATSTTAGVYVRPLPVEMGGNPTLELSAVGHFSMSTATNAINACNALSLIAASARSATFSATSATAGYVAGNGSILEQSAAGYGRLVWNPA